MKSFFITGMYRSGTTLLAKLLDAHPQAAVASQPAPLLFSEVKKQFLLTVNSAPLYPLGHLFNEAVYSTLDFENFLLKQHFSREFIGQTMALMKNYSGQYSQELLPELAALEGGDLASIYQQITEIAAGKTRNTNVLCAGTKEIICEEFNPYFLSQNIPVIHIIRDPRDVLASANKGQKMGHVRPTLFTLRQWRKSIAFALALAARPNYLCIRYEDLVHDPDTCLDIIVRFLELPGFDKKFRSGEIIGRQGEAWKGNSAYQQYSGIVTDSANRYQQALTEDAIIYTELFCYPEMKAMGYHRDFITEKEYTKENLLRQKEPFIINHPAFDAAYSESEINLQAEAERLRLLKSAVKPDIADLQRLFVFEKSFAALQESL